MDDMLRKRVSELINPGWFKYFDSVGSTNDVAQKWVSEGCPDFSLVMADEQTEGRGRNTRKWYTLPNSSLAFSLVLTSKLTISNLPYYTGLGAVAVSRVLERITNSRVEIKWPNDVLLEGKKVVGILVEGVWSGNMLNGIIIGIGINVTSESVPEDVELLFPATYVERESSKPVNRFDLLLNVISEISNVRHTCTFDDLIKLWDERLAFKGEKVYLIDSAGEQVFGTLIGISEQGKLIMELEDGECQHFSSNEIRLRPFSE